MKEYFLVRKDIEGLRKNGQWQDVSPEAIRQAATLEADLEKVDLYLNRQDAEQSALDGTELANDTDFFPVIRVEVMNNRLKGRATEVELEDGTILPTRTFSVKDVKLTDVYLSHINVRYKDVNLATDVAPVLDVQVRTTKVQLSAFIPTPLNLAKGGLAIAAAGAAYYFGNDAVVDLVAQAGLAVPAMLATSATLPLAVGATARLATEVPELSAKGLNLAKKGANAVVNSNVASAVASKVAPVTERLTPMLPSRESAFKTSVALAVGGAALYAGNEAVVGLVEKAAVTVPEAVAGSPFLPAGIVGAVRLVAELPQLAMKGVTRLGQLGAAGIEAIKARRASSARLVQAPRVKSAGNTKALRELNLEPRAITHAHNASAMTRDSLRDLIPQKEQPTNDNSIKPSIH